MICIRGLRRGKPHSLRYSAISLRYSAFKQMVYPYRLLNPGKIKALMHK